MMTPAGSHEFSPCCRRRSRRSRGWRSTCAGSGTTARIASGRPQPRGLARRRATRCWSIQNTPRSRLEELARDAEFVERVRQLDRSETEYLSRPSWFQQASRSTRRRVIAYFSMEYGLTDALPLYSGGLGVLAGDHLKTASDLGVPLVAVGLFYREGYFRQMLDADGAQLEIYAVNSRESLPVRLVTDAEGMPLRVTIELPGRDLRVRVWRADVGRVPLYLLDSDDPLNSPFDRGITAQALRAATARRGCCRRSCSASVAGARSRRWASTWRSATSTRATRRSPPSSGRVRSPQPTAAISSRRCGPRAAATSSRPTRRWRPHSTRSRVPLL